MLDGLRQFLLRVLRVPAEPHPPDAGPARVFRAAPAYYKYRLVLWGLKQLAAFIGLLGGVIGIYFASRELNDPTFTMVMGVIEGVAWGAFLLQVVVSLGVLRFDYEMRWYIVTDRAMRVREGIIRVREQTMTFANVQKVGVRQGPLQRLLGIADVHVTSAGGGGASDPESGRMGSNMHEVYFRGVDNAPEIRESIRRRAAANRGAGLGDPDDHHAPAGAAPALAAARELLVEVRSLREVAGGRASW